jgi:hypothetical protein
MRRPGRIRIKLAAALTAAIQDYIPGATVSPSDLWENRSPFLSQGGACRWGGNIPVPGTQGSVYLHSWDTMTECLRAGITLRGHDGTTSIEVMANG